MIFALHSVVDDGTFHVDHTLRCPTGKLEWVCDFLPHQSLLLEQVQDLPILLFAAQYYKSANGFDRTMVKVTGVDKRTGKLIYDKEFVPHVQFHALRIDPRAGLIELRRQDLKIELRADTGQAAKAEPAGDQPVSTIARERRVIEEKKEERKDR